MKMESEHAYKRSIHVEAMSSGQIMLFNIWEMVRFGKISHYSANFSLLRGARGVDLPTQDKTEIEPTKEDIVAFSVFYDVCRYCPSEGETPGQIFKQVIDQLVENASLFWGKEKSKEISREIIKAFGEEPECFGVSTTEEDRMGYACAKI